VWLEPALTWSGRRSSSQPCMLSRSASSGRVVVGEVALFASVQPAGSPQLKPSALLTEPTLEATLDAWSSGGREITVDSSEERGVLVDSVLVGPKI